MAKRGTTRSTDVEPPVPLEDLAVALAALKPSVSIEGWDACPPTVRPPRVDVLVPGAVFDVAAVVRVVKALCALRHTKGRWARKPLVPDPWQIVWVIAPTFGWKYPDDYHDDELAGCRIVRELDVEVPRKNGKSTLSSGLALVLVAADGELGAEVYAAASSRDQARVVFDEAKRMAQGSPALAKRCQPLAQVIRFPGTASSFRVLSKVAEAAHGLNVHAAVIDELHVHRSRDLVDAIETGTGARRQPLIVAITTADDGTEGTIYDEKHTRAELLASGSVVDPSTWAVVWAADPTDDPFAEATWRKANPGLGITVQRSTIAAAAEKARTTPSYYPTFARLHLNLRTRAEVKWLPLPAWDRTAGIVTAETFQGRRAWGGLDLSTTTDLTAFVLVAGSSTDGFDVWPMLWLPGDNVEDLERRLGVPLARWAREGWLKLTDGNVVDYRQVRADIVDAIDTLGVSVVSVGYDPWNATETVLELQEAGVPMVEVRQNFGRLSAPSKELERLVLGSTAEKPLLRHGGHPVLRWMADCVEVRQDPNGNIRPVKPDRLKTTRRIDGVVALVMALAEATAGQVAGGDPLAAWVSAVSWPCACGAFVPLDQQRCPSCGAVREEVSDGSVASA